MYQRSKNLNMLSQLLQLKLQCIETSSMIGQLLRLFFLCVYLKKLPVYPVITTHTHRVITKKNLKSKINNNFFK